MEFLVILLFFLGFFWLIIKLHKKISGGVGYSSLTPEERARRLAEHDRFLTLRALDRIERNTDHNNGPRRY